MVFSLVFLCWRKRETSDQPEFYENVDLQLNQKVFILVLHSKLVIEHLWFTLFIVGVVLFDLIVEIEFIF